MYFFHAGRRLFTCIDLELKKKKRKKIITYTAKAMCNMVTGGAHAQLLLYNNTVKTIYIYDIYV